MSTRRVHGREGRCMKGDVKRNTSATIGWRDEIQPEVQSRAAVCAFQVHGDSGSIADLPDAASTAVAVANRGSI